MTEMWENDQDRNSSSLAIASLSVSKASIISLILGHAALTHASTCSHPEDENMSYGKVQTFLYSV